MFWNERKFVGIFDGIIVESQIRGKLIFMLGFEEQLANEVTKFFLYIVLKNVFVIISNFFIYSFKPYSKIIKNNLFNIKIYFAINILLNTD